MSSFERRSFLLMPLALAACGFRPVYGPGSPAAGILGTVRAADPSDKNGFDFVERIEERLGRPESHRFDLSYVISTDRIGVGLTSDRRTTRYNLRGQVNWQLVERATNRKIASDLAQSFTTYAATGSTVAGVAAEEDAAQRLMRILADQVVTRLMAELASEG